MPWEKVIFSNYPEGYITDIWRDHLNARYLYKINDLDDYGWRIAPDLSFPLFIDGIRWNETGFSVDGSPVWTNSLGTEYLWTNYSSWRITKCPGKLDGENDYWYEGPVTDETKFGTYEGRGGYTGYTPRTVVGTPDHRWKLENEDENAPAGIYKKNGDSDITVGTEQYHGDPGYWNKSAIDETGHRTYVGEDMGEYNTIHFVVSISKWVMGIYNSENGWLESDTEPNKDSSVAFVPKKTETGVYPFDMTEEELYDIYVEFSRNVMAGIRKQIYFANIGLFLK